METRWWNKHSPSRSAWGPTPEMLALSRWLYSFPKSREQRRNNDTPLVQGHAASVPLKPFIPSHHQLNQISYIYATKIKDVLPWKLWISACVLKAWWLQHHSGAPSYHPPRLLKVCATVVPDPHSSCFQTMRLKFIICLSETFRSDEGRLRGMASINTLSGSHVYSWLVIVNCVSLFFCWFMTLHHLSAQNSYISPVYIKPDKRLSHVTQI